MKASVYIATSLDGFIARTNGDIDWLSVGGESQSDGDYGYQVFMDTVDVIVMGRNTFEKALTFGAWPYSGQRVVVLSRTMLEVPADLAPSVTVSRLTPTDLVVQLAAEGAQHLYIDGGQTIQGFLKAGLISELIITRIPVLIGDGIPLFGPLTHDIELQHIETQQFSNGFVQSRYQPIYRDE